jgi:hypothetical protein
MNPLIGQPRGITIFVDVNGVTYLVIAVGTQILYTPYPFKAPFQPVPNLSFVGLGPVCFVRCIQGVIQNADGSLTDIDPVPILMIQDGVSRAAYWDGKNSRHLDPTKPVSPAGVQLGGPSEAPIGLWSAWSGNRYWVSNGPRVRASDLLNPYKFTEENILQEGGFLQFPAPITAMTNTWDFTELLVYTGHTTSTLQSSLLDRTQWATTQAFQKVVFSNIGAVGGNAVTTQWGMTWWYSHDGLMSLDEGLRAMQSSKITFRDREMAWSKGNISPGSKTNIAMGSFENLLLISVPSGDVYNSHTWVMDEAPLDVLTYWGYFGLPSWSGIWEGVRPVAWTRAIVNGIERVFCISQDYPNLNDALQTPKNNVWEAITEMRADKSVDIGLVPHVRPIQCSLETKLIGYDGTYKFFRFAEIYLDNLEGEIDLTVSYAPRRGGYKQILTKHIIASDWLVQNPLVPIIVGPTPSVPAISDPYSVFDVRPQSRVVRTISEAKSYTGPNTGDDVWQSVQTSANVPFPRQKDYAFSLLIQWTGRLSVSSVRMYFDPEEQEVEGIAEVDEGTDRFVDYAGRNFILPEHLPYILDITSLNFKSHVITGTAPIWTDPLFQSLS